MLTPLQHECIIYLFTLERVYWTTQQIADEVKTSIYYVNETIDEWFGLSCHGLDKERDIEISELVKIER